MWDGWPVWGTTGWPHGGGVWGTGRETVKKKSNWFPEPISQKCGNYAALCQLTFFSTCFINSDLLKITCFVLQTYSDMFESWVSNVWEIHVVKRSSNVSFSERMDCRCKKCGIHFRVSLQSSIFLFQLPLELLIFCLLAGLCQLLAECLWNLDQGVFTWRQ